MAGSSGGEVELARLRQNTGHGGERRWNTGYGTGERGVEWYRK